MYFLDPELTVEILLLERNEPGSSHALGIMDPVD